MPNEWTTYTAEELKGLSHATPSEWDKATSKLRNKDTVSNDPVAQPDHYNKGAIEAIEAIKASMHPTEYKGYLKGNCLKYLWRYEYKNGIEDLKKAQVYLNWLVQELS